MEIILIAIAAFLAGAFISSLSYRRTIARLRRKVRVLSAGGEVQKMETTKKVIWICLANGFAWVWCSYILAYLDHPQIAESLSQVAVTEIIGVVLAYCIKSAVENLSRHNHWPDKQQNSQTNDSAEQEDTSGKG